MRLRNSFYCSRYVTRVSKAIDVLRSAQFLVWPQISNTGRIFCYAANFLTFLRQNKLQRVCILHLQFVRSTLQLCSRRSVLLEQSQLCGSCFFPCFSQFSEHSSCKAHLLLKHTSNLVSTKITPIYQKRKKRKSYMSCLTRSA